MHLRCGAHVLNLIVKEGLSDIGDSVASIRNAVKYVRSSDSRLQAFKSRVGSDNFNRGSLVLDCATRWNSTFLMLSSALKYKEIFNRMKMEDKLYEDYFAEDDDSRTGKKRIGPPSENDWENAHRLVRFLKIFYESTLAFSATTKVTSTCYYNEIIKIETVLLSLANNPDHEMSKMAKIMRFKFDKYWEGTERINKLLIVASVFDPRSKMSFVTHCFDKMYGKDSAKSVDMKKSITDVLHRLFVSYYEWYKYKTPSGERCESRKSSVEMSESSSNMNGVDIDMGFIYEDDPFASFAQMIVDKGVVEESPNELDIYLMEKVEVMKPNSLGCEFDILSWWKTTNGKFPILAEMARDLLAIPVSTVSSESAFSTGGRILDQYRSCLTPDMVESLILTQNWLMSHLISDEKRNFSELIAENEFMFALAEEFRKSSGQSDLCVV
ncbi:PREDICTED: zinc finger BED domain-containing protein RICESLEEPER 2-like [Tarenaya hassleriana]|uniref:zinc finger BED domain-containing protein RICESLEEPER 2-like n=1 Tax=Tarenaya hassleriana TaxID=28532 RepID=UPI00053C93B9|nr:PREDICTED: zinc finger BED domain-containing protein RICESLEEPER 2-like [Tarenaya hassleriana]XP_010532459.1 PREDICTED: zinc finger BED domain-containing protein RICESLEEPER 2-like [Tarenaya hassleriana]